MTHDVATSVKTIHETSIKTTWTSRNISVNSQTKWRTEWPLAIALSTSLIGR